MSIDAPSIPLNRFVTTAAISSLVTAWYKRQRRLTGTAASVPARTVSVAVAARHIDSGEGIVAERWPQELDVDRVPVRVRVLQQVRERSP